MITETLLIIAGSVAVAGGIATYAIVSKIMASSRRIYITTDAQSISSQALELNVPPKEIQSEAPKPAEIPASIVSPSASVASAPIQEAPAPFSEDLVSTPSTAAPTDITALANITSSIDATSGVLVIPTPKRRTRTKRLAVDGSTATTRRRRSSRNKPAVPAVISDSQPVVAETQSASQPTPQNTGAQTSS